MMRESRDIRGMLREAGEAARGRDLAPEAVARVQREAARLIPGRAAARTPAPWLWQPSLGLALAALLCLAACLWLVLAGDKAPVPMVAQHAVPAPRLGAGQVESIDAQFAQRERAAREAVQAAQRRYAVGGAAGPRSITEDLDRRVAAITWRLQTE